MSLLLVLQLLLDESLDLDLVIIMVVWHASCCDTLESYHVLIATVRACGIIYLLRIMHTPMNGLLRVPFLGAMVLSVFCS